MIKLIVEWRSSEAEADKSRIKTSQFWQKKLIYFKYLIRFVEIKSYLSTWTENQNYFFLIENVFFNANYKKLKIII